jgi:signal transduction histidine kinase
MFVKRIKNINTATEKVTNGDYNIMIDVHGKDELSQLSQRFNKMVQALKSNEYLNKSFVRNFSHELKTPLAAIKGYADLLLEEDCDTSEMKDYAKIISEEAQRLSVLAQHLLELSYIDANAITQKNDTFNVIEQIRNVIQLLQFQWEEKQIQLQLDLEDTLIQSNKILLYQVWKNLIENAIKFTPSSGHIQISMVVVNNQLTVTIKNNGVQVSKQDLNHITELFYVADSAHKSIGNGIGLSIVKRIIQKLDGTLHFDSNEIDTFEVSVVLPIKPMD